MLILRALPSEQIGPRRLCGVQHEGHELHQRVLPRGGHDAVPYDRRRAAPNRPAIEQREEITTKQETQDQQDDDPPETQPQPATPEAATAPSFAATILDLRAVSAWGPLHGSSPSASSGSFSRE